MKIRTTGASPFGRKVRVAALYLGLSDVEIVGTDYLDPADPLRVENPLGKMPVLTTDDGEYIYDSSVILEYLDMIADGSLFPVDPQERVKVRIVEALCDGIADAGVSIVMEGRMRPPEKRHQPWIEHQRGKMDRGLEAIAAMAIDPRRIDAGSIALACTLSWIDFRKPTEWRAAHPGLINWLDEFAAAVPAFALTAPPAA